MRTTIDIDEELIERAAQELGTTNKVDTVTEALTFLPTVDGSQWHLMTLSFGEVLN
jgi:Arc/MetJ family transcription regulator